MGKKNPADEILHAEEAEATPTEPAEETVTEFKMKLNKYGFFHVPKKAIASLPFKAEEKLTATIEGETVVIRKA